MDCRVKPGNDEIKKVAATLIDATAAIRNTPFGVI
jgi:hypothetical protein